LRLFFPALLLYLRAWTLRGDFLGEAVVLLDVVLSVAPPVPTCDDTPPAGIACKVAVGFDPVQFKSLGLHVAQRFWLFLFMLMEQFYTGRS
jgi:hypothetical protein